jgi:hypothetical protein
MRENVIRVLPLSSEEISIDVRVQWLLALVSDIGEYSGLSRAIELPASTFQAMHDELRRGRHLNARSEGSETQYDVFWDGSSGRRSHLSQESTSAKSMLRYLECFRTFFRDAAVRNWEQIGQGHTSDLSINILPVRMGNSHIPRRGWESGASFSNTPKPKPRCYCDTFLRHTIIESLSKEQPMFLYFGSFLGKKAEI